MVFYLASKNRHKLDEFSALLQAYDIELWSVPGEASAPSEDGDSFAENAVKKALHYGQNLSGWVLADDSGLCVDALSGGPGVRSARFASEDADDAANNHKLLSLLEGVPEPSRTAHFVCALALWRQGMSKPLVVVGEVQGRIAQSPRGDEGFGYDPLFLVDGWDKTFAEMTAVQKSRCSHRASAVRQLMTKWGDEGDAHLYRQ